MLNNNVSKYYIKKLGFEDKRIFKIQILVRKQLFLKNIVFLANIQFKNIVTKKSINPIS